MTNAYFHGVIYNQWTIFPQGFDPTTSGLVCRPSPCGDFDANRISNLTDVELLESAILRRPRVVGNKLRFDVNKVRPATVRRRPLRLELLEERRLLVNGAPVVAIDYAATPSLEFHGAAAEDQYGHSVSLLGDVSGDAMADLLVGIRWRTPTA